MKGMGYPGTKKNKKYGSKSHKKGGPKTYGALKATKSVKKIGAI